MFKIPFRLRAKEGEGSDGGGAGGGDGGTDAAAAAAAAATDAGKGGDGATGGDAGAAAAAGAGKGGVLDAARARAAAKSETPEAKAAREAAEAAAKAGTRPEYLPEQFWDPSTKAPRTESIVKAWKDTATELKTLKGAKGAPPAKADDYKFERPKDLPAHILADPSKDVDLRVLRETALAAGLTQAQFEKQAAAYFATAAKMIPAPADPIEELKKLGENGEAVADTVFAWLDGLVAQDVLSKDELEEVVATGATAPGMRALNKLREFAGGAPIPVKAADGAPSYTADELYSMVGTEKYQKDPAERARVDKLFEAHFGTEPAGSSRAGIGVR